MSSDYFFFEKPVKGLKVLLPPDLLKDYAILYYCC